MNVAFFSAGVMWVAMLGLLSIAGPNHALNAGDCVTGSVMISYIRMPYLLNNR
jgi:hypothetical protein